MLVDNDITLLAQVLWDYHHLGQALKKADYIMGLGSYDLRVADHCAELYCEGWAPHLVFSGKSGNWTQGMWDKSEAEIFSARAIQKGVPPSNISLEKNATNLGENMLYTKKLLMQSSMPPQRVIIVTKPTTERRAFTTCKKVWPEIDMMVTSPPLTFETQVNQVVSQENLINEMVGDIQRIQQYPNLGFQVPQDIPGDVWQAYEELVSLGYDKHLMK